MRLPYIILFVSFIVGIVIRLVISKHPSVYLLGDEILVTLVALQPLDLFFETLKFEPHPFLYYFFIKFLHNAFDSLILIRIFLITFTYTIIFISTLYLDTKGILKKYDLYGGLALFFSSFLFLRIMGEFKQDSLSFPITYMLLSFMLVFISKYLKGVEKKRLVWTFSNREFNVFFITSTILTGMLFFIGYVPYLYMVILLLLLLVSTGKYRYIAYLILVQVAIILAYTYFIGFEQFAINTHRFGWAQTLPNSFFFGIDRYVGASKPIGDFKDILKLLPIFFVTAFLFKKNKKKYEIVTLLLLTLLFVMGYMFRFWVRPRYMIPFYILLSVVSWWGIQSIKILKQYSKQILFFWVFILFVFSSFLYQQDYEVSENYISKDIDNEIAFAEKNKSPNSGVTGLMVVYSLKYVNHKIMFPDRHKDYVPVYIHNPEIKYPTIDVQELLRYAIFRDITEEKLACNLKKTGYKSFLVEPPRFIDSAIFPVVINTLNDYCEFKMSEDGQIIIFAQNCNFDDINCSN